ncbi:E3 ubiquitin-protein ligase CBL-B-like [Sycon ciliatum]|uniref:E3 ubiquitin-protein ligase CBL-B-like n=1 Tax=Sycon ciliatum TaxID=27933 RepID=UPI0020AB8C06|eukprot:scpid41969/ scgid10868/ E3 ubiquitin-protein ligase CBL-B; SH3-binding protein CBL-B; Signal transduction protein CBL-B
MENFMTSGTFVQGRKALFAVKKAMQGKSVIDRKAVDKTWKLMVTVVKLCGNARLNITNSPPCILDILPDTYGHLQMILDKCNDNFDALNSCPYFRVLLDNIAAKCRQVIQLFKVAKDSIYDETSLERRSLTKFALIFSHMYSELKALYPNGACIGRTFPITKTAAAEFWHSHFGNRYCVPWRDFVTHFESEHTIRSNMEVIALKSTIDLTCNDHVTVFEFDVFTLLFQPWQSIVRNWNILAVTHAGYQAFLTYDEVKDKLLKISTNRVGSYLFRLSCTRLGQWAIGHITPEGNIVQTIPQNKSLIQALVDGHKEGFYMHPMGREQNPDISDTLEDLPTVSIHVTQEQYELYMEIDSSFELCKICTVNKKDVRIEPCCHLVCADCLEHWLESNGSGCPFCRMEIKSTESVVVHPFHDRNECSTPEMPEAPPPKPSADDTSIPSSSAFPQCERPMQRHATFSGNSTAAANNCGPPVPWRKGSTSRSRSGDASPLPPIPPLLGSAAAVANSRPPLPALPNKADGSPSYSIPPIEYETHASFASHHSSVDLGVVGPGGDYAMPNKHRDTPCSSSLSSADHGTSPRSMTLPASLPREALNFPSADTSSANQQYSTPSMQSSSGFSPPSSPERRRAPGSPLASRSPSIGMTQTEMQLKAMGFKESDIQKAVKIAGDDLALAMRILENFKSHEKKTLEQQLLELGYLEADVKKAIQVAGDNRDLAVMILEQFAGN